MGTYRAVNFVQALRLPRSLYYEFVKRNKLYANIKRLQDNREFLQNTWLFGEVVSYPTQNRIAQAMRYHFYHSGFVFPQEVHSTIFLIKNGCLENCCGDDVCETLLEGNFFGEECVLFEAESLFRIRTTSPTEIFQIPGTVLLDIPVVRWKLFETFQKRKKNINPEMEKICS